MLISIHMPKTAGNSFGASLQAHFGDGLLRDYDDKPLAYSALQRNKMALFNNLTLKHTDWSRIHCIHGHFLPLKYRCLRTRHKLHVITWLRDPVDRALSHYYYWKRKNYALANAHPLYRKMIASSWSAEQFCLRREIRNIYCQFLWGFPLARLDFIGITERYNQDFARFTHRYLGQASTPKKHNVNQAAARQYQLSSRQRQRIEAFHQKDMQLYQFVKKQSTY